MVSRAVYNLLSTNSTLTALVSTRIYPVRTPQAVTAPFLVYAISSEPVDTKDGIATQELHEIQVTAFALTYESAQSIKAAVKSALDRKNGTIQSNKVQTIIFVDERDGYEDAPKLFKVDLLFEMRRNV